MSINTSKYLINRFSTQTFKKQHHVTSSRLSNPVHPSELTTAHKKKHLLYRKLGSSTRPHPLHIILKHMLLNHTPINKHTPHYHLDLIYSEFSLCILLSGKLPHPYMLFFTIHHSNLILRFNRRILLFPILTNFLFFFKFTHALEFYIILHKLCVSQLSPDDGLSESKHFVSEKRKMVFQIIKIACETKKLSNFIRKKYTCNWFYPLH
jgi:hypothetical protein